MRSAKRAWQSWQRMPVGCYPIKPPYFTGARTETGSPPDTRAAIWNGKKDADGSIHICSLAFPNASPQLVIAPGRTPLHSLVVTLDGKALSGASSVQELQMANLLAETLDHAV